MRKILIVFAITLLLSSVTATCANGSAQGSATSGKCCSSWDAAATPAAAVMLKGTGVGTCGTAAAATTGFASQAAVDPTACIAGYALVSGTCTICAAGKYSLAGAATCTDCPAGTYSAATGNDALADCTACPAGTYSAATGNDALSDCTNCPAGTYSAATGNDDVSDCTACDVGKGSPAGSDAVGDCVTCTGLVPNGKNCDGVALTVPISCLDGFTVDTVANPDECDACGVGNCKTCAFASITDDCSACKSGFKLTAKVVSPAAPATCTPCTIGGCDTCTVAGTPAVETCSKCKAGFAKTLTADKITACTDCTTIEGCTSCTGDVTVCSVAKPGWYIKTGTTPVLTKCPAGQTSAAAATGADDATGCTLACDAGANCQDCRADQAQCLDCGANSYLDTTCQTHDANSLHPSCKTAWGIDSQGKADWCVTCTDPNKVLVPTIAASADGKTPASPYGTCKCKENFKTTAAADATQDSTCTPCGDNVKNCDDANKLVCKDATFFPAGVNCAAKPTDNSAVAGFFFNSTANKFQACDKSCATCTAAASATACKTCPAATGTTAPASTDATFEKYLQKPWYNATTCFATCPEAYVANEAQDMCEESSSSSFLSVIALILIALLF